MESLVKCPCGNEFKVKPSRALRSKFCSKKCKYRFYTKRSGLIYNITKENSKWFKQGHQPFNKGTIGLMKRNSRSFKKGDHASIKTEYKKGQFAKEKHPKWNGGITPLHIKIRTCDKYKEWRSGVFSRDNFTCQICGHRGGDLEADHYPTQFSKIFHSNMIDSLEKAIECPAFWDVDNGRTLCKTCHKLKGEKKYYGK